MFLSRDLNYFKVRYLMLNLAIECEVERSELTSVANGNEAACLSVCQHADMLLIDAFKKFIKVLWLWQLLHQQLVTGFIYVVSK